MAGLAGLLSIVFPRRLDVSSSAPQSCSGFPDAAVLIVYPGFDERYGVSVLARILSDQQLTFTKLGHVFIACAAINDVVAWTLLAWVTAMSTALSRPDKRQCARRYLASKQSEARGRCRGDSRADHDGGSDSSVLQLRRIKPISV